MKFEVDHQEKSYAEDFSISHYSLLQTYKKSNSKFWSFLRSINFLGAFELFFILLLTPVSFFFLYLIVSLFSFFPENYLHLLRFLGFLFFAISLLCIIFLPRIIYNKRTRYDLLNMVGIKFKNIDFENLDKKMQSLEDVLVSLSDKKVLCESWKENVKMFGLNKRAINSFMDIVERDETWRVNLMAIDNKNIAKNNDSILVKKYRSLEFKEIGDILKNMDGDKNK
ncbi:MAG: hypothetical protein RSN61_21270 [Chryseobacterium sp.]|uniref:hypothetical protein n=1 Tax=Chryseobacterium sp. TaxID=1871047 RepID=UPI002FC67C9D